MYEKSQLTFVEDCLDFFHFPSKKFFRKENIQFSSRRFFLCPEIAHADFNAEQLVPD